MDIDVLGSYNTAKATLPYLQESAAKHKVDSKTCTNFDFYISQLLINLFLVEPSPLGTGGRIIFVSATFHYTGMIFQTHVSVAKAGVDALSNNIALEFGPLGITSNIISPGPIANTEVDHRRRSSVINSVLTDCRASRGFYLAHLKMNLGSGSLWDDMGR